MKAFCGHTIFLFLLAGVWANHAYGQDIYSVLEPECYTEYGDNWNCFGDTDSFATGSEIFRNAVAGADGCEDQWGDLTDGPDSVGVYLDFKGCFGTIYTNGYVGGPYSGYTDDYGPAEEESIGIYMYLSGDDLEAYQEIDCSDNIIAYAQPGATGCT